MTVHILSPTVVTLAACFTLGSTPILAAPGDLDASFGTGGEIVDSLGHDAGIGRAVLVQPDGKIVVAGSAEQGSWLSDFALMRYLPDGTRDASFGQSGRVFTNLGGTNTSGRSLALQPDGKLIVAGRVAAGTDRFDFALARYHTNGAVDTSFGSSGLATLGLAGIKGVANGVALQSDGKIVLAGAYQYDINAQERMVVARYLANGTLDTSFGIGGKVIPYIGGVWDSASSVVIQPDGKIVVGGSASETNVQECFALVRLHPNGTLDDSFGAGGKVTTLVKGDTLSGGQSVLRQDDGKIVLAGFAWKDGLDMALARYHVDGTLDSSFGEGGMVVTSFTAGAPELGYGAALQSDGRILLTGTSEANGTNCLTVARYLSNGALDTSFGSGGRVTSNFGRNSAYYDSPGRSVAVQGDGKIIAVGGTDVGYRTLRLALARYLGTTAPEIAVEQPEGMNLTDGSANVDFGSAATGGGMVARTFTLRNPSTATLLGLVVSRDGLQGSEDFSVGQPPVTLLGPGGSTTFTVTFAPTAPGLRRAILHIASNDADENPFDLTVSGTGVGEVVPGALDALNGIGGRMTTPIGNSNDRVGGLVLQRDGKLLVAGYSFNGTNYDFALARYGAGLYLDVAFGNAGVVTTPVGNSHDYGHSVAVQPDGKIVVAGNSLNASNSDIALARYHVNGTLDTSFGNGGKVVTAFSGTSGETAWSVAVQPDGKIVVAGHTDNGTVNEDFALVRYNSDGSLDTAFGTGGKVTNAIGSDDDFGYSLTLQHDGKLVVAGQAKSSTGNDAFALARYLPNGALDPTFGTGGKVITPFGSSNSGGYSVAVQDDGKLLVAGHCSVGSTTEFDFALARYLPDGTLDSSFGSGGQMTTDLAHRSDDLGRSVVPQSDGKIVVAGSASGGANYDFALVRYLANGTLDAGFGHGGKMLTPISVSDDFGVSLVLQPDGKLVIAGDTRWADNYDFALVGVLGTTTSEIAVEQPAGNNLTDGSAMVDFGSVALGGGPVVRTFTVRNASTMMLTGLAVTKDGANAGDFTVGALTTTQLGNGESTTFTVTFTPSAAGARSAAIHLASNDADENPFHIALTGTGLTGPEITTPSPLPSGMVGVPYNFSLQASGGATPYAWSLVGGSLPSGLALSGAGLIEGIPASVTTAGFTVRVSASDGRAATNAFTLAVVPALHSGDLDPTFGTGGKTVTPMGNADDFGYSAAVQADGKIVVAGYASISNRQNFALARYLPDGSLDPAFGSGGKVTTPFGLDSGYGRSVALQRDGKILVAGDSPTQGSYKFALVRYEPDGSLDTTFGSGGRMTNLVGTASYGKTVMVQSDGTIVMAGEVNAGGVDFGVARWLGGGSLDPAFGNGGVMTADLGATPDFDYAQGAALQADDKIVVVGYTAGTSASDFGLVRFLANGILDTSFGTGGVVTTPFGNSQDLARNAAVQADGKILVTGEVGRDFGLARYLADGALDASFGSGGKVNTAIDRFEAFPRSLAVQGDGRIVVAGYTSNGKDNDFAVARYNPDGTLDASFNSDGKLMTDFGNGHDRARSVVLQRDGKIVVAGESYNGTNYDFAVVRYIGSLAPEIAVEQPAGTALADGSANIDFGGVSLNSTSVVRAVTLRNLGSGSLTGLAITKNGANAGDFSVEPLPTTSLAPGASVSFNVTFTPSALGSRTAAIHIASDDADESPFDITLTGTGGSYTPLQTWRLARFGSPDNSGDGADANDFDKDGVVNLLEYAFGGDPKIPDAAIQRPTAALAGGKLLYTFTCDARCMDITYIVQATASLETASWTDIAKSVGGGMVLPVGSLSEVSDTGAGSRKATVTASTALFPTGRGFLRVRISY